MNVLVFNVYKKCSSCSIFPETESWDMTRPNPWGLSYHIPVLIMMQFIFIILFGLFTRFYCQFLSPNISIVIAGTILRQLLETIMRETLERGLTTVITWLWKYTQVRMIRNFKICSVSPFPIQCFKTSMWWSSLVSDSWWLSSKDTDCQPFHWTCWYQPSQSSGPS